MAAFISLFRSINVGGRVIRMDELKDLYVSLGFKNVTTYIQSGNVVCTAVEDDPTELTARIEEGFAKKFSFRTNALVRTAAELNDIIARNPFANQPEKEPKWVVVVFLASSPDSSALEELKKAYTGPEEFFLIGQELYVYYPNGIGRSKLTLALIERKLKTIGTARNWNTVLQLQNIAERLDI